MVQQKTYNSGKILVFKTLGISKMQYLAQMAHVPRHIIEQLKCLHKKILWNNRLSKIKHSTLIGEYYDGGLKDIDIEAKFKALKLTWNKRLCDDSDHPWKIIPTKFLKLPNHNQISHRNFSLDQTSLSKIQGIPVFYVDLLLKNFSEIGINTVGDFLIWMVPFVTSKS